LKKQVKRFTGISMYVLAILCLLNSIGTMAFNISFWPFFLFLSIVLAALGYIHLKVRVKRDNKFIKYGIIIAHTLSILFIISFIIIEGLIIRAGSTRDTETPDYVVILGAGLNGDVPSLTLSQRLKASLELLEVLPEETRIVVSGGQGPGETITEAEAMKSYLVRHGISEDRIIKEDKSTSTEENLVFSRKLIREIDSKENLKITIVTSNFHMFRSNALAKEVGFDDVQSWSAPIHSYLIPTYYVREYLAIINSLILN